ncbi:MAG: hypothetical protein EOM34_05425 [Clostridia bacterium]|nr:hypothetical protein [Clostridia bacterium]
MSENSNKKEETGKMSLKTIIRQAMIYLFVIAVGGIFIFVLFRWDAIKHSIGTLFRILAPVITGIVIAYVLLPVVEFF